MRQAWQELAPTLGISSQISPRAFLGLGPRLRSLHLQKNQLQAIPALPPFSQLELIDLSGNPFHCDCQLLPLHRWAPPLLPPPRGGLGTHQWLSVRPHSLPRAPWPCGRACCGERVLPEPAAGPEGARSAWGLGVDFSGPGFPHSSSQPRGAGPNKYLWALH